MKKLLIAIISLSIIALCAIAIKYNAIAYLLNRQYTETDSLYIGRKYYFPSVNRYYGPPFVAVNSLTWEGVELGRRLFYDKHLSKSGERSCASCHHSVYALSDSGVQFSLNETGKTARNAPSLQNLAWSRSFFWDGRALNLTIQQKDAFEHELSFKFKDAVSYLSTDTTDVKLFKKAFGKTGAINEDNIYRAITEFLLSAVSFNSKFDSVIRGQAEFTASERRGYYDIYLKPKGECFQCHKSPLSTTLLTDDKFHNNGLDFVAKEEDFADAGHGKITGKKADYGTFKTPGLRNIALTAPYMHDGRFRSLSQVIDFYSDSIKLSPTLDAHLRPHIDTTGAEGHKNTGGLHFTKSEKQDLLNFLYTLTDNTFTTNPALQDPFNP